MIGPEILFSIFFLTLGITFIIIGLSILQQKRNIENIPTSKIRSLAMGIVEIIGNVKHVDTKQQVVGEDKLLSPLSQKKCVYYKIQIQEYKKRGKNSQWVTIHKEELSPPFYVQDDTGKIRIDTKGATIDVKETFKEESRWGKDPSKNVMQYIKMKGINFEGFLGINKTMRFIEQAIFDSDKVYVMGEAMHKSVSDPEVIIGKKKGLGFYYISNKSEEALIKSFNLKAIFWNISGIILLLISVAIYLR